MEKKEFKIGEEFQFGLKKLKCVKSDGNMCRSCELKVIDCCLGIEKFIGGCAKAERIDRTNVMFIKVEE